MKKIQAFSIGTTLLLLVSTAFAQDDVSEWIEEPAAQQASEDPAPVDPPPVKESKKMKVKKKVIVTKEHGTSVDDGSGRTLVVVDQAPARFSVPPPPSPPPRRHILAKEVYTHDGIYFRGGFDMGALVLTNVSSPSSDSMLSSSAFGLNIGIGWTLGKGVVLGARGSLEGAFGLRLHSEGKNYTLRGRLLSGEAQVFADWYVFPKKGFHVETGIGMGLINYDPMLYDNSGKRMEYSRELISGVTGILGAGYEWWVGTHCSLGVLFRLNWGVYKGQVGDGALMRTIEPQDGKDSLMLFGPMLGFTATAN